MCPFVLTVAGFFPIKKEKEHLPQFLVNHKSRGHVGGKAATCSDLLDLVVPSRYLLRQLEEIGGTERCWHSRPPLFCLRKLMSNYLGEIVPLSQMVGTYDLLSNAAGIAQQFKTCGRKVRKVGSDRWAAGLTAAHIQPSCSLFTWKQNDGCVPPLIRHGEEALGGVRVTLYNT